jgi:hybrid cluster-associated redox disulfide protein
MVPKKAITKNMLIGDIVTKYPSSIPTMLDYGLHCIGCHVATWETLEQGASSHHIDVDKLVNEINETLEAKK